MCALIQILVKQLNKYTLIHISFAGIHIKKTLCAGTAGRCVQFLGTSMKRFVSRQTMVGAAHVHFVIVGVVGHHVNMKTEQMRWVSLYV